MIDKWEFYLHDFLWPSDASNIGRMGAEYQAVTRPAQEAGVNSIEWVYPPLTGCCEVPTSPTLVSIVPSGEMSGTLAEAGELLAFCMGLRGKCTCGKGGLRVH